MALTYKDGKYFNNGVEIDPFLDMSPDEVQDQFGYSTPYIGANYATSAPNTSNPLYNAYMSNNGQLPQAQTQTPPTSIPSSGTPAFNPPPPNMGVTSIPAIGGDPVDPMDIYGPSNVVLNPTAHQNPAVQAGIDAGLYNTSTPTAPPSIPATGTPAVPSTPSTPAAQWSPDQLRQLINLLNAGGQPSGQTQMPQYQQPDTSYNDAIMALLTQQQAAPQGSQEAFLPATSTGELSQALQDAALQGLNAPYGYTAEEQALIRERAMSDFNVNQEQDLQTLQNRYQQYGLNRGAGLGGQAGSSLQDYFGKRAIAQSNLEADLALQMSDRAAQDRQNAINNAMGINTQLYDQTRGDFADMLSLMQFDQQAGNDEFDKLMDTVKFMSAEQQQNFLNQQSISDREWQAYWQQRQYEDSLSKQNLDYLQAATGASPDALLNALTWAGSNEANVLASGQSDPNSAIAPLLMMAMMNQSQGDGGGLFEDVIVPGGKMVWDAAKNTYKFVSGLFDGDSVGGVTVPENIPTPEGYTSDEATQDAMNIASVVAMTGAALSAAAWVGVIGTNLSRWNKKNAEREEPRPPEVMMGDFLDKTYGELSTVDPQYKLSDNDKAVWKAGVIQDWKNRANVGFDEVLADWMPGGMNGVWNKRSVA